MNIKDLKKQDRFFSKNEYGDERIKNLKKDIKFIKELMKDITQFKKDMENNNFSKIILSESNYSFYTLAIDQDLEGALDSTKRQLKSAFNERFYLQRAARFLELTGNTIIDRKAIQLLEDCRYILIKGEATEEEIFSILPSNHKLTK